MSNFETILYKIYEGSGEGAENIYLKYSMDENPQFGGSTGGVGVLSSEQRKLECGGGV